MSPSCAPRRAALLACALVGVPAPRANADALFKGLGDLAGGPFESIANGISSDGSTIVGQSRSAGGNESFSWTLAGGIKGIGDLPGGDFNGQAFGASLGGSAIVGGGTNSAGRIEAYRWTAGGGMVGLGVLPGDTDSQARGVSADGSVVIGASGAPDNTGQAFRWTQATGLVGLGDLPGGTFLSGAIAVSADGGVIAGTGSVDAGFRAYKWTEQGGMKPVPLLPQTDISSAYGMSGDGVAIVGEAAKDNSNSSHAYLWFEGLAPIDLGDLPGGNVQADARDCSLGGGTVIGNSSSSKGYVPFIWDLAHGMRELQTVLVTDFGLDLTGWKLQFASAISDDGTVITGFGLNPQGQTEGWVAIVPAPGAAGLWLAALAACARRRR